MSAPIILSAEATITTGSVLLDVYRTRSASRGPILIDGVRLRPGQDATGSGFSASGLNAGVWARMTLGRQPLTGGSGGYVPVPSLGGIENNRGSVGSIQESNAATPGTVIAASAFLWKFGKPMYVPATTQVETWIQLAVPAIGVAAPTTTVARATYICRSLPTNTRPPNKICIPYATTFFTDSPSSGSAQLTSGETALANPFSTPLYIDSFTVRCVGSSGNIQRYDLAQNSPTLRLTDPDGRIVIRDLTPLAIVAPYVFTWNVNAVLRHGGFFKAYIAPGTTWSNVCRYLITMRGYREVDYKVGGQL